MIKVTEMHYLQFTVEDSFTREDFNDLLRAVEPGMQATELQVTEEVGRQISVLTRDGKPATLPTNHPGKLLRIPITPTQLPGVNRLLIVRWTQEPKSFVTLSNELHAYLELMVKHGTVQPGTLGSALENMLQAPHDILAGWFGLADDDARVAATIKELETLAATHGPKTFLSDIEALDHPSYAEDRLRRLAAKDNFIGLQLQDLHTPEVIFNTYVRRRQLVVYCEKHGVRVTSVKWGRRLDTHSWVQKVARPVWEARRCKPKES